MEKKTELTVKISDPVAVRVLKGPHVNLVDNGLLPPLRREPLVESRRNVLGRHEPVGHTQRNENEKFQHVAFKKKKKILYQQLAMNDISVVRHSDTTRLVQQAFYLYTVLVYIAYTGTNIYVHFVISVRIEAD